MNRKKTAFIIVFGIIIVTAVCGILICVSCQKRNTDRKLFEQLTGIVLPKVVCIEKSAERYVEYAFLITMDQTTAQLVDYELRNSPNIDEGVSNVKEKFFDVKVIEGFPFQLEWIHRREKQFISGFVTIGNSINGSDKTQVTVLLMKSTASEEYAMIVKW